MAAGVLQQYLHYKLLNSFLADVAIVSEAVLYLGEIPLLYCTALYILIS